MPDISTNWTEVINKVKHVEVSFSQMLGLFRENWVDWVLRRFYWLEACLMLRSHPSSVRKVLNSCDFYSQEENSFKHGEYTFHHSLVWSVLKYIWKKCYNWCYMLMTRCMVSQLLERLEIPKPDWQVTFPHNSNILSSKQVLRINQTYQLQGVYVIHIIKIQNLKFLKNIVSREI